MSDELMEHGLVIYADGSFRNNRGGWGLHGYTYNRTPVTEGKPSDQLPTMQGYDVTEYPNTVTIVKTINAYGEVLLHPTNNTGELQGAIEAFKIAITSALPNFTLLSDSEYVLKNLKSSVAKWKASGWKTSTGNPVANVPYWVELSDLMDAYKKIGNVELKWVRGHNGDRGNEAADANAKLGSGGSSKEAAFTAPEAQAKLKPVEFNPLVFKASMIFNVQTGGVIEDDGYYNFYTLGRSHTYGFKPDDNAIAKLSKTDLILGRRLAECMYSVYKANEPDPYLNLLMKQHASAFDFENNELAVMRLQNAYKPAVHKRIQTSGVDGLVRMSDIGALVTADDELISKTLSPPRMAFYAVDHLTEMRRMLDAMLNDNLGPYVSKSEVTDKFFITDTSGKKTVTKLLPTITNTTPVIPLTVDVDGVKVTIRPVLGLDLPVRNTLAKVAEMEPKVFVLACMLGPINYRYMTVIQTNNGTAIYNCPCSSFLLKRS